MRREIKDKVHAGQTSRRGRRGNNSYINSRSSFDRAFAQAKNARKNSPQKKPIRKSTRGQRRTQIDASEQKQEESGCGGK